MRVSKRFVDRAKGSLRRYQKLLANAKNRDVNESDTVVIITDFLSDVLGYDKYDDLTTEHAVRCTYCDLAIKRNGRLRFLLEVKSIGTDLKNNHIKQACDYGSNEGVDWVLLTNGAEWQAYRILFQKPIGHDLVFSVNLLDPQVRTSELLEQLYIISKEGGAGDAIDEYWKQRDATSRHLLAQVLMSEPTMRIVRRQLRSMFPGLKADTEALTKIVADEVIKRELLEGEKATAASRRVRRGARRKSREQVAAMELTSASATQPVTEGT